CARYFSDWDSLDVW
nr:immunoglobulin heavy chain junction region [Macaca mulatta]MOV49738.1 immunoglobulin heavy chain junction region [Macaca mulatta]MOV52372.1 immunoglobulin heavy chain junction region [Macaca mulatta]